MGYPDPFRLWGMGEGSRYFPPTTGRVGGEGFSPYRHPVFPVRFCLGMMVTMAYAYMYLLMFAPVRYCV